MKSDNSSYHWSNSPRCQCGPSSKRVLRHISPPRNARRGSRACRTCRARSTPMPEPDIREVSRRTESGGFTWGHGLPPVRGSEALVTPKREQFADPGQPRAGRLAPGQPHAGRQAAVHTPGTPTPNAGHSHAEPRAPRRRTPGTPTPNAGSRTSGTPTPSTRAPQRRTPGRRAPGPPGTRRRQGGEQVVGCLRCGRAGRKNQGQEPPTNGKAPHPVRERCLPEGAGVRAPRRAWPSPTSCWRPGSGG